MIVIKQNGFKVFVVNTRWGTRYQSAMVVNGRRVWARDYPVTNDEIEVNEFIEPNDAEWMEMMK